MLETLARTGLCAIIRCPQAGFAADIGRTLLANGVEVLEVSLTTPDAIEAIEQLTAIASRDHDRAWVGAGTVLTRQDLQSVVAVGARFTVTPAACEAVSASIDAGVPVLAGAWTPSEVLAAHLAGATAVKVFPASSGGPGHLKAVREPLPQVPLVAVGGVSLVDVTSYRAAGALAVGIGSPLIGDAATGGSLDDLAVRATRFVEACRP
ncbi:MULTISPECIES: bifunctional 4-hydroxy-2-oxoglutarate aldolase/2-dehydro-3-deoxy-phosphogluconate aldolase [Aestuariimicrobium]|uniref:bifunctional 4-hydroxy-2-oxoglutarate aldolase/2-dehydro-3-deoxy-phosphogluconate aldolase n=1 Tax=Aestuariimicrobium TaxID=396388 RepID=UPI000428D10B|nr:MULTISPECIES: bifunctional 4-hydroxy-2-oxoglutarate aldolase/2-dehydro-3-deoxy-phosphogluconate aldolase [Aestuariimicrobium]CAI9401480.1 KHG/KDPG aldolase [Aestuariimicrobium sp. T2.26MG-19.2B]